VTVPAGGERRPLERFLRGYSRGSSTATRSSLAESSTSPTARSALGSALARTSWTGLDRTPGSGRGRACPRLNGINSPSATGVGDVLAVFVQHIRRGRLEPKLVGESSSLDQLDG